MIEILSESEITILFALIAAIVLQLVSSYLKKDSAEMWSPMTMISAVYLYYCVVGPIKMVIDGDFSLRTIDHRPYLYSAWLGALVSYLATWFGFIVYNKKNFKILKPVINIEALTRNAVIVFFIAFGLLVIFVGPNFMSQITFFDQSDNDGTGGYNGSLSGYLMQSLIFFVGASMLAFIPFLKNKNKIWFFMIFAISAALFINGGFRYRLVLLCYSLISVYHLTKEVRFNWKLVFGLLFPFLLLMGAMELARSYGSGLNTERLEGVETEELLNSSTSETAVFMATGFVIDEYSKHFDFSHFDFLINAIAAPIPRAIWSSKPDGSYMLDVIPELYGGSKGTGQAFLHYAEFYVAFGWYGIIIIPFFAGLLLKRFWLWYKVNRANEYVIILISIVNSMLYVWVSRGYFSQFLTLFVFACLPVWILYQKNAK